MIIVVTDGNETSSNADLSDVVAAARKGHVSVYVIGITSRLFSPGALKKLAAGTGGRYYAAASPGFLHRIYSSIADELSRTWQIEYLTAARPGRQGRRHRRPLRTGHGCLGVRRDLRRRTGSRGRARCPT